jgi:hypothetical protein
MAVAPRPPAEPATPLPAPEAVPAPDQARTVAHLSQTVLSALGHVSRHVAAAQASGSDAVSRTFNLDHASRHIGDAVSHQRKLLSALTQYNPAIGAELGKLRQVTEAGAPPDAPPPDQDARGADYDVTAPDPFAPQPVLPSIRP